MSGGNNLSLVQSVLVVLGSDKPKRILQMEKERSSRDGLSKGIQQSTGR